MCLAAVAYPNVELRNSIVAAFRCIWLRLARTPCFLLKVPNRLPL